MSVVYMTILTRMIIIYVLIYVAKTEDCNKNWRILESVLDKDQLKEY